MQLLLILKPACPSCNTPLGALVNNYVQKIINREKIMWVESSMWNTLVMVYVANTAKQQYQSPQQCTMAKTIHVGLNIV